jgi:hypothetical protein
MAQTESPLVRLPAAIVSRRAAKGKYFYEFEIGSYIFLAFLAPSREKRIGQNSRQVLYAGQRLTFYSLVDVFFLGPNGMGRREMENPQPELERDAILRLRNGDRCICREKGGLNQIRFPLLQNKRALPSLKICAKDWLNARWGRYYHLTLLAEFPVIPYSGNLNLARIRG